MQFVLDRLQDACDDLPVEACSSSRDPTPLGWLIFHAERGIELCQLCLDHYYSRDFDPEEMRRSLASRRRGWLDLENDGKPLAPARPSRPWTEMTCRDWLSAKERLLLMIHASYPRLSHAYRVSRAAVYRPSEMLMVLAANIELCAFAKHPERERLLETRAQDLPGVASQSLAVNDEPVCAYSLSALLDALHRFLSQISRLRFSPDLARYLWLLELRSAHFLMYTFDAISHDSLDYRRKVTKPQREGAEDALVGEEFGANRRYLADVTSLLVALHAKFVMAQQYARETPSEALIEEDARLRRALRDWFRERSKAMTTDTASEWFERVYVRSQLRPAEKEIFERDYPNETSTELTVLAKYRTKNGEYKRIMQETERPVKEIILRDLDRPEGETLSLQYALHEMFALHLRNQCSSLDWSTYSWTERAYELQSAALRLDGNPRIVQTFNYYQFFTGEHFIQFDSYIASLARFLRVVARERDGLLTPRFHLHPFLSRMFGKQTLALALPELCPPEYHIKLPPSRRKRRRQEVEEEAEAEEEGNEDETRMLGRVEFDQ